MNWLTFTISAYVGLVLEIGLRPLLDIGGASPSFLLVLGMFIGLLGSPATVTGAMFILGVLVDLQAGPTAGGVIVGPATLGYLAGAVVVVQLRSLVFRESVWSLAFMTFTAGLVVQLVVVLLYVMRGWPITPPAAVAGWSTADQLVQRFLVLIYSAVLAVPMGLGLFRYAHLWRFEHKVRG